MTDEGEEPAETEPVEDVPTADPDDDEGQVAGENLSPERKSQDPVTAEELRGVSEGKVEAPDPSPEPAEHDE